MREATITWRNDLKTLHGFLIVLALVTTCVLAPWGYTALRLANARREGVYASAEQGMLALIKEQYAPDFKMKISYAGPDAHDGSKPYVWYVIAEVRASAYADGSAVGHNGCDAPGTFFLQTSDGNWVHVGEGFFTLFMTSWMEVFDMAGEGQSTPSTDLLQRQPRQFCR